MFKGKKPFYPIPDLCCCGCNEIVWNGHKYISGHNSRINNPSSNYEVANKISKSLIGKKKSEKHKNNLSKSHKGKIPWNKGIPRTVEEKNNISKSLIGYKPSQETRKIWSVQRCLENNSNWKGGISFEPYCEKFNNTLKEQIRNRDNRICQECSKNEFENGEKLIVHHIHYDKPNCNPDLISLCRSCNSKANYDRDYWEKHFMNKLEERRLLC